MTAGECLGSEHASNPNIGPGLRWQSGNRIGRNLHHSERTGKFDSVGTGRRGAIEAMTTAPSLELALISAAILGFRHGFDYDHVAAISDITSVQPTAKRGMQLGSLYALGHAVMVAVLGSAVILFQIALPPGIDRLAERLVGFTLVILGIYVLGSLFRGVPSPKSRFVLLSHAFRWLHWKALGHRHPELPRPQPGNWNYDRKSVFLIGVVHGLGAETPTQLFIFLLAANLGGTAKGFLGLGVFLGGLLAMNTLMTAAAAGLFGFTTRMPRFQYAITAVTAVYSLVVGAIFLLESSSSLPPMGS
jgi:high-affinity nickel-transport protein